jgi:hypothetical protein
MADTRIPRTSSGFNAYINNTKNYLLLDTTVQPGMYIPQPFPPILPTGAAPLVAVIPSLKNWQRLWLLPSEMDKWTSFCLQYNTLYAKYSDKKESRTTAVRDNLLKVIDDFSAFATPILNRIEGDVYVTIDDLSVFHIKSGFMRDQHPTRHRVPIVDVPVFGMTPLGGGDMRFTIRSTHDASRASKLPGTEIEVRYQLLFIDEPTPKHIDDMTKQYLSSKALFVFHCGADKTGKNMWAAVRYIVVNDPSRNGPWSTIQYMGIA